MMMPKKFLFADLDDTLFQSKRKCPDGAALAPAAYLKDGTAHSFLTPGQQSVLQLFQQEMVVIPVTARNADAYSRVQLGFQHEAVVNFGGIILNKDGKPDGEWLNRSKNLACSSESILEEIRESIIRFASSTGLSIRARIISDFGIPFYVSAKSEEGDEAAIDQIEAMTLAILDVSDANVSSHRNGNNLAVLPDWLDKRHAVAYLAKKLRDTHGEIVTFGMGDSLSDIGFMADCDYALVPQASQINRQMRGL
ncbi:MAG: hypothetical protein Q8O37_14485 [Sulfuricellaceae bacterium]|nr:hypothetical protein [Sulfuricellaceae bacterium]